MVRWLAVSLLMLGSGCPGTSGEADRGGTESPWIPLPDLVGGCAGCAGCCLPGGACVAQSNEKHCGINGALCVDCTLVSSPCLNGICQTCTPACQGKPCGALDGCEGACQPGSGCSQTAGTLEEHFLGSQVDFARWGIATTGSSTVKVGAGELSLVVSAAPAAMAELYSRESFPVGSTLEARVHLSAGQFYDHRGLGFSNRRVSAHCGEAQGESAAVQWRAQDEAWGVESLASFTEFDCPVLSTTYAAGWRTLKVVRRSTRVEYLEDGVLKKTISDLARLPSGALPVRFSAFTFSSAGSASPITIRIDWVRVTPN